jgi:hypothetical protein
MSVDVLEGHAAVHKIPIIIITICTYLEVSDRSVLSQETIRFCVDWVPQRRAFGLTSGLRDLMPDHR